MQAKMDNHKEPRADRRKKADKRKETYERFGGKSQRHVRIVAATAAASSTKALKATK